MFGILVAVLIAQASAVPDASWIPVPLETSKSLQTSEYAHYERHEKDGSVSVIVAFSQECTCQPDHMMEMLTATLKPLNATVHRDSVTACGAKAERLIATGIADVKSGRHNWEAIAFRNEPNLYVQQYIFDGAAPAPDAETSLINLCPSAATKS